MARKKVLKAQQPVAHPLEFCGCKAKLTKLMCGLVCEDKGRVCPQLPEAVKASLAPLEPQPDTSMIAQIAARARNQPVLEDRKRRYQEHLASQD